MATQLPGSPEPECPGRDMLNACRRTSHRVPLIYRSLVLNSAIFR